MRKYFGLIAIMTLSIWANPLKWYHAYAPAVAEAKAQHKLIYVFIDAIGCPYCEKMRRNVLETPDVAHALRSYVLLNLKINHPDVRKHFPHTQVSPTSYFLDSTGHILSDFAGYTNDEFFFWRMDEADQMAKNR